VVTTRRADLERMLRDWTSAAERLTIGRPVDDPATSAALPPTDTGEAEGLHPARLTLTVGFGPTLFELDGVDRFGLAAQRPAALVDIPAFPGDALEADRSGGDLCVQACGDDPQVLFHAIRNLTRIGRGVVRLRWSQEGFGRTSSTTAAQATPRNLLGFKDGTDNLRAGTDELDDNVWVAAADGPTWMAGGSYMVTRRIRNLIEVWDRSSLAEQERVIGRVRSTGAPLGSSAERDPIDLSATDAAGLPLIDPSAHVAVANQDALGIHILRRGYNFTDGLDPRVGQLDAGLFFIAYQRDPRAQFIPMQQKLAASDLLNEYIKHVGSAVFAVPPGVVPGGWWGQELMQA
jgi:deferrochelatase/peroxidase EfeB